MIPEQIPVNNHYGNNEATQFDFDFFIENEEQITVTHTDFQGNETYPVLGVDYSIKSVGQKDGSYIVFPLADSKYNVLGWDLTTGQKELLTIELNIPIEQPAEYQMSTKLSLKNIEGSFDYLTRICQILRRLLDRALKVSESVADMNMNLPLPIPNNVFKWDETGTSLENYDIIGENNAFKTQLLSDVDAVQQEMNATIAQNKKDTDDEIERFETETTAKINQNQTDIQNQFNEYKAKNDNDNLDFRDTVNHTLQTSIDNINTSVDEFKGITTQEIATFEENTNIALGSMRDQLDQTMTEYQLQTNADIEDFKLSVESTISTVQDAAEKINELEEAMSEVSVKADDVSQKADRVENLATEVSAKADEVLSTVDNLANKDLSNLSELGEARFNAKADNTRVITVENSIAELQNSKADASSLNSEVTSLNTQIESLNTTVSENKTSCESNLATVKNDLTILIKGKADEDIVRQIRNCTYKGTNLEEKFADEISGYANKYVWLEERKKVGDYKGIYAGDYIQTSIKAGSIAGYNIAAQNFTARIIGIDTYKDCGDTVIGNMLYFKTDQAIDTPIKWNPTDNNNGTSKQNSPWLASAMYAILNGVNNYDNSSAYNKVAHGANGGAGIISLLPAELKSVLKEKRQLLNNRYSASGLLTGSTGWAWANMGKLWLPNEIEVYGCGIRSNLCQTAGFWFPEAGCSIQFPWFANNCSNRVTKISNGNRCNWWLSSVASYNSTSVCTVYGHGNADSRLATFATIYAPLCFCI